ncbi:MAG: hypothetical protein PHY47_01280 [Lachnospiraceae bacterium]|nr:hypothetical protein [Lachnospiraceae bacterium]
MSDNKRREAAKKIAGEVQKRRREQQYQLMCNWRDGINRVTGIATIEKIVELEHLIDLRPEDFSPSKPMPPKATPPGII